MEILWFFFFLLCFFVLFCFAERADLGGVYYYFFLQWHFTMDLFVAIYNKLYLAYLFISLFISTRIISRVTAWRTSFSPVFLSLSLSTGLETESQRREERSFSITPPVLKLTPCRCAGQALEGLPCPPHVHHSVGHQRGVIEEEESRLWWG